MIQGHKDQLTMKWMFDDGTEMTFFDWNTGQPNNGPADYYLYFRAQEQCKWHDDFGGTVRPFICELQL